MDLQELEHDELSSDGETECGSNSADGEGEGDYEGEGDGEGKGDGVGEGDGEGEGTVVDDFEEETTGMWEPDFQCDAEFEAAIVDQERGEEDAAKTTDNQNSIENDSVSIIHIEWSITHMHCPACCSWTASIQNDLECLRCWHHRDRINSHN